MRTTIYSLIILIFISTSLHAQQTSWRISLKSPGNPAKSYSLTPKENALVANEKLPVEIKRTVDDNEHGYVVRMVVEANERAYFNLEQVTTFDYNHSDCQFLLPGFWYRQNMRSPERAPSFRTGDSWHVREDRLSIPMTGIYNQTTGEYSTVLRMDKLDKETLCAHNSGEVILGGETSLGFTGFRNINGKASLVYGFPYSEGPKTYIRKLTLAPEVTTFHKLEAGESISMSWEIQKGRAEDFSGFVAQVWNYSFDHFKPQMVESGYSNQSAKEVLSNFFKQSYVGKYDLKYYSGVHMRVDDCLSVGSTEVGFVGRVLLNAFNALEYGEANARPDLVKDANSIFASYLKCGFTSNGFFREFVDMKNRKEPDSYSIRRQSEGAYAVLNYLNYERNKGRSHPEWEAKIKRLLDNFMELQNADGSFPRKFNNSFGIIDPTGGSTPSATLPLTMAYTYFGGDKYLRSAKHTASYLEKELISKADYFSSTLDADCEDKEASLYASTAMYYLTFVTKGKEREHYAELCKKSAYFTLSWYYMWDVPFAQGQMLGDVGFKSRGWGNVSVENNHIDVFIFEFATILDWLAEQNGDSRLSAFSDVIKSSMLQLMPVEGHMFDVACVGYYPEVVQHTNWDYGKNGKGFYNDIFAPGWTVASLWQMLSPERVENYFRHTTNN